MQLFCNTHQTPLAYALYMYKSNPVISANCRHPDGCFGLLALISAVRTAQQNSHQTTQSHTIHKDPLNHPSSQHWLPSNAHTIIVMPAYAHTSRAIWHPWLTTPMHTTTCTYSLTILCTHSVSHANATLHSHVAHSHINTCTHRKHALMTAGAHAQIHALYARTHTHMCTHMCAHCIMHYAIILQHQTPFAYAVSKFLQKEKDVQVSTHSHHTHK